MEDYSKNENNQKTPVEVFRDEIDQRLKSIESKSRARVYRVPQELRKVKESAYAPSLVSIGPLHSEDPHLQSQMMDVKFVYMNSLFVRVFELDGAAAANVGGVWVPLVMKNCLDEMEKSILLPEVKNFYAEEKVDAKMLLIDGCFILELLRRFTEEIMAVEEEPEEERRLCNPIFDCFSSLQTGLLRRNEDSSTNQSSKSQKNIQKMLPDPIFSFPLIRVAVQHDLLLLENQLPLLVLKNLFCLTLGRLPGHLRLREYILNYFHGILNIGHKKSTDCLPKKTKFSATYYHHEVDLEGLEGYDHILHFLHSHYLPDPLPEPTKVGGQHIKFMPFASHLDSSGVKFEGNEDQFEVQFEPRLCTCRRARFSIPTLHIDDSTELVLRNFIAFEKCVPYVSGYFTSYAYLLDQLINTDEDFQVLEEAEVIRNRLGTSKEASDLFNNLCKEVALGGFHFAKIRSKVVEYNKHCWLAALPITIQHLKRKWSANPWAFVAFLVAFAAFAMQATEFITSYTG